MQTRETIEAELAKLSPAQRRALRKEFPGRGGIEHLRCHEFLGRVDVVYVGLADSHLYYRIWIGPRGAIKSRECLGLRADLQTAG